MAPSTAIEANKTATTPVSSSEPKEVPKDPVPDADNDPKEEEEAQNILDSDSSLSLLSGSGRRGNKDILGMLGEELDQQTDFMCEE